MACVKYLIVGAFLVLISPVSLSADVPEGGKAYGAPQRFESSIKSFEAADAKNPPAPGGIVCVGSSSIVNWHPTIQKDLAPLKIIARGFGGSNMNDALYYVDRVVIKYRPRAVVVYEGDNDIEQGIAPQKIRDTFVTFVAAIHKKLPNTRIYLLSIKPSPSRWSLWPRASEANKLLRSVCEGDKLLTYVSIVEPMLQPNGKVREDIFRLDRLHMNAVGYKLWRAVLQPILLKKELTGEITAPAR